MTNEWVDRDASRFLITIGGRVEQWVLTHARQLANSHGPDPDGVVYIRPEDVRIALRAFVREGLDELESLVNHHRAPSAAAVA